MNRTTPAEIRRANLAAVAQARALVRKPPKLHSADVGRLSFLAELGHIDSNLATMIIEHLPFHAVSISSRDRSAIDTDTPVAVAKALRRLLPEGAFQGLAMWESSSGHWLELRKADPAVGWISTPPAATGIARADLVGRPFVHTGSQRRMGQETTHLVQHQGRKSRSGRLRAGVLAAHLRPLRHADRFSSVWVSPFLSSAVSASPPMCGCLSMACIYTGVSGVRSVRPWRCRAARCRLRSSQAMAGVAVTP
jgi:hypothetical protein